MAAGRMHASMRRLSVAEPSASLDLAFDRVRQAGWIGTDRAHMLGEATDNTCNSGIVSIIVNRAGFAGGSKL
jgi:hypothetical protein